MLRATKTKLLVSAAQDKNTKLIPSSSSSSSSHTTAAQLTNPPINTWRGPNREDTFSLQTQIAECSAAFHNPDGTISHLYFTVIKAHTDSDEGPVCPPQLTGGAQWWGEACVHPARGGTEEHEPKVVFLNELLHLDYLASFWYLLRVSVFERCLTQQEGCTPRVLFRIESPFAFVFKYLYYHFCSLIRVRAAPWNVRMCIMPLEAAA